MLKALDLAGLVSVLEAVFANLNKFPSYSISTLSRQKAAKARRTLHYRYVNKVD